MKPLKRILMLLFLVLCYIKGFSQVGIGTTAPDPSSILDIESSNSGILIPRIALTSSTDTATISGSEATGLLIYNTSTTADVTPGFYFWNSSAWERIVSGSSGSGWGLSGNSGTTNGTHFIGTTDSQALDIRTNNIIKTRLTTKGQLEILNTGSSIFFGNDAGESDNLSDNRNIFVGESSGSDNNNGANNIALGYYSLRTNGYGNFNVAIGSHALENGGNKTRNIGIGHQALQEATGPNNIGIGYQVLQTSTTAGNNVAIGDRAMSTNINGAANVALGYNTMYSNDDGDRNVAIGYQAMYSNTSGNSNNAIGYNALTANTSGANNVSIGPNTMESNTIGSNNVALGVQSLNANISGFHNVALGFQALYRNTSGSNNVGIGNKSLSNNTTGTNNFAVGDDALINNTTGSYNISMGRRANFGNTAGNYNLAFGTNANANITTGLNNVGVGTSANFYNETGSNNVSVGHGAGTGVSGTSVSGNVNIGFQAGHGNTTSNKLYIDNSGTSIPLIGGDFSANTLGVNRSIASLTNTFEVGGEASKATSGSWLANSDRRLKKEIKRIKGKDAIELIKQLRGVTYKWDDNVTGMPRPESTQYGFIAQEILEVFPDKVIQDNQGYYQTAYGDYDALFVESIKILCEEIASLKSEIEKLKKP